MIDKDTLDGVDREARMLARLGDDGLDDRLDDEIDNPHPDEDVSAETRCARQADAFVRVLESYLEPDARPRATAEKYQVHVHLDLRRDADAPVADPDAPALSEETIRRLGCEANLVVVLHEGDEILSVGRRTRAVPPALTGYPLEVLGHAHRHLDVSAETWRCHWDGAAPDYGTMVEILGRRPPPPDDDTLSRREP